MSCYQFYYNEVLWVDIIFFSAGPLNLIDFVFSDFLPLCKVYEAWIRKVKSPVANVLAMVIYFYYFICFEMHYIRVMWNDSWKVSKFHSFWWKWAALKVYLHLLFCSYSRVIMWSVLNWDPDQSLDKVRHQILRLQWTWVKMFPAREINRIPNTLRENLKHANTRIKVVYTVFSVRWLKLWIKASKEWGSDEKQKYSGWILWRISAVKDLQAKNT